MKLRITRKTWTASSKNGTLSNLADMFEDWQRLEPGEVRGDLPPEQDGEDSLTIRVIKADAGATMLVRFSKADRYQTYAFDIDEITGEAAAFIKLFLKPSAEDAPTRPTGLPGEVRVITTGRPRENSAIDLRRRIFSAFARLGPSATLEQVADTEFRWSGENLKARLKGQGLSFRQLKSEFKKSV